MKRIMCEKKFVWWGLIAAACLSMVFSNVSYDAEYQIAMAYRLIKGDELITQMWEPHQTSAFLCFTLMKLYLMVAHTTTGIVLYLQIVGFAIRGGISLLIYRSFRKFTLQWPAAAAGILYLLISPKDLMMPEFSNMQLWFGTLLFLALLQYIDKRSLLMLIVSAVSFCLGVFSYPSFLIVYFAVVAILFRYSEKKGRDILIFTGICAGIGGTFVAYLLVSIDLETMFRCIQNALSLEPSHTVGLVQKAVGHLGNLLKIFIVLGAAGIVGLLAELAAGAAEARRKGKTRSFSRERWLVLSWYVLMLLFFGNILSVKDRGMFGIPLLAAVFKGFMERKRLSCRERCLYDTALGIGVMSMAATLLFSDHPFLQAIPYMLATIGASAIPLYHWISDSDMSDGLRKACMSGMYLFLALFLFRCIYIHIPMYGRSQICSLADDLALVRSGPAAGIVTDESGAARQRDSMEEWKLYIQEGDTIWIIGEPVDTLGYLYENVEVGAPTVMSTPTYREELLDYWELNPEKYPDVIIVASSFGELSWDIARNEWLMKWLEEEYCAGRVIDGNYWRYYFRE